MCDERYYRPRPQWIWNPRTNPDLTATAGLRAHLTGAPETIRGALRDWLEPPAGAVEGRTRHGGVSIDVEAGRSDGVTICFTSSGQDALESLDAAVLDFHAQVLRGHPRIEVRWEELPLG